MFAPLLIGLSGSSSESDVQSQSGHRSFANLLETAKGRRRHLSFCRDLKHFDVQLLGPKPWKETLRAVVLPRRPQRFDPLPPG